MHPVTYRLSYDATVAVDNQRRQRSPAASLLLHVLRCAKKLHAAEAALSSGILDYSVSSAAAFNDAVKAAQSAAAAVDAGGVATAVPASPSPEQVFIAVLDARCRERAASSGAAAAAQSDDGGGTGRKQKVDAQTVSFLLGNEIAALKAVVDAAENQRPAAEAAGGGSAAASQATVETAFNLVLRQSAGALDAAARHKRRLTTIAHAQVLIAELEKKKVHCRGLPRLWHRVCTLCHHVLPMLANVVARDCRFALVPTSLHSFFLL